MISAFKKNISDRTSQSAGAGIRASIFNRCNDASMTTREIPLVHASCDIVTLSCSLHTVTHAINDIIARDRIKRDFSFTGETVKVRF